MASMRLGAPLDLFRRGRYPRHILLRLAEMGFELCRALGEPARVVGELADLGAQETAPTLEARVAGKHLRHLDRHAQQRRRNDDDAPAMGLLHDVVEMLDEIGVDRFGGHEHQRDVLRFAGDQIALGDVLDVPADVGAHALLRRAARVFVARSLRAR